MFLPVVSWAGLYLLYRYRPLKLKRALAKAVEETVKSFDDNLLGANNDWWNTFTTAVNSPTWDDWIQKHHPTTNKRFIARLKLELRAMGKLRSSLRDLWESRQKGVRRTEVEEIMNKIWNIEFDLKASRSIGYLSMHDLRDQYEAWIRDQDVFVYGTLPEDPTVSDQFKERVKKMEEHELKIPLWENWLAKQEAEQSKKLWVPTGEYYLRYGEPEEGLFNWIFSRFEATMEGNHGQYLEMWRAFDVEAERLSIFLNTVVAILYTVARVMLLAIMFSSLRAAPDGVYDTPDWTRFMPSFS